MEIPLNAQYIRNIIMGAHATHDHIVHFYHLTALDWVDIVSSLDGDPKETAALAAKLSDWPRNTVQEIRASKERIATFVKSGQLGIYSSGYWGHPAMKLAPEVNLLAVHHYLQALEYQRRINQVVAILGSKTPHVQTIQVGGMTNQINPDSPTALGMERLYLVKTLLDEADEFVKKVLLVDTAAVGAMYADWTGHGKGVVNYLSAPYMPRDTKGKKFHLPGGYIPEGPPSKFTHIKRFQDDFFSKIAHERTKYDRYNGDWDRYP